MVILGGNLLISVEYHSNSVPYFQPSDRSRLMQVQGRSESGFLVEDIAGCFLTKRGW